MIFMLRKWYVLLGVNFESIDEKSTAEFVKFYKVLFPKVCWAAQSSLPGAMDSPRQAAVTGGI